MFQTGDMVMYGGMGLCRVEAIAPRAVPGSKEERLYYTLHPVHETGVVYTPVDTDVFMRAVMSATQANALIDLMPSVTELEDIPADYRQLAERYRAVLQTHDTQQLLRLLKTVWARASRCRDQGKALGKVDRQYQQMAERFLYEELACALSIPTDTVEDYIQARLDAQQAR